jgi:hypothetical protein
MRRFLVTVHVILVVAGLGLGGYVGFRAFDLMGSDAAGDLPSYLILAVLALLLVVAAGAVRPHDVVEAPAAAPAPQRRAPNQPPFPPGGGYRPGGPHTGSQPPLQGGPHTGQQPPLQGGPHTGQQPPLPGHHTGSQPPIGPEGYPGRQDQYPR